MSYDLTVNAMLDPDGNLVALEVTDESGIMAFDEAILEAWRLAAPFPNPPPGMVQEDGFIHIDNFGFHIEIGRARAELTGIDPRQGVMFPGLQTTPNR
jgi:TonB family protein